MKSSTTFALTILLLFATTLTALAQEKEDSKTQTWYGVLDVGPAKLRMQVEIEVDESGKHSGKAISLDQGNAEMVFNECTLNEKELSFTINSVRANFKGALNEDQTVAEGEFSQNGAKFPFKLEIVDSIPTNEHTETWTGKMNAGVQEFDFQFRIYEDAEKNKSARLDSFTEKIGDIPCAVERDGTTITIKVAIAAAPATFVGTYDGEKNEIVGKWEQRDAKYPLSLKQVPLQSTREVTLNRPQTPQGPFEYDSEIVTIKNEKDDLTLGGTLTTPKGDGPFPVVVLISGSGPQDRDETIFSHKPFFVIADHLAKNGIGVLRYDDRGTADSSGDFHTATSADFANDAEAVLEFLKTHKKADGTKLYLCGHSEGGIIAPMIASRRDDVAGIILLAGPGVNGRQIAFNQSRLMATAAGAKESEMKINDTLLETIFEYQDKNVPLGAEFLDDFVEKVEASLPAEAAEEFDAQQLREAVKLAVARADTPWSKFFATYEPATSLSKVKCPVLAIVGEKDLQVDPKLNNPAIEKALKDGGNSEYEIKVLPSLNHLFQKCETGAMSEYNEIEQTIDESVLNLLTSWLIKISE